MAGSPDRPARVRLVALGCRVSRADSDALAAGLGDGLALARDGERADLVVVNTCAVTADADAAARQAIRRAGREHPGARIVAAGCGAATCPAALASLPGVAAVVPPRAQGALPEILGRLATPTATPTSTSTSTSTSTPTSTPTSTSTSTPTPTSTSTSTSTAPLWPPAGAPARHTRPFLKIQDGCDRRCAYCLVPAARGPSRSLPEREALARIAALGRGHAEVVLTGVHLGAWGRDLAPPSDLGELLRAAVRLRAVGRLRLSSVEPDELPLDALRDPGVAAVVCEHLHLPVQSGSERILAAMGRAGGADVFRRAVAGAARALPGACLGTDLVCGFPGETDRDHRDTVDLVASLPLAYLHVFPFSPRPGTPAAAMGGAVSPGVVRARVAELRELSERRWRAFLSAQVGRTVEVVVERVRDGIARGTARAYASVRWPASGEARGDVVRVRVDGSDGAECTGARAG